LDSTDFHAVAAVSATCLAFGWSLANLVALLRMNLFTRRNLMAWLDKPFATPPGPSGQLGFRLILGSTKEARL
jgi:hypothetical protein